MLPGQGVFVLSAIGQDRVDQQLVRILLRKVGSTIVLVELRRRAPNNHTFSSFIEYLRDTSQQPLAI